MDVPATDSKKTQKDDPKKQQSNELTEDKPNKKNTDNKKVKKERAPRNDDWKKELEATMTVDTKIPPAPKDKDLLLKPNQDLFNANLEKIAKKIEKNLKEIDEIKKQEKDLREDIYSKNNSEFITLKAFSEKRKEIAAKISSNKKEREEVKTKLASLEEGIAKIKKKCLNGKVYKKEEIQSRISDMEKDYKNSLKTANDEKKYLDEIGQLKAMIPFGEEISKISGQTEVLEKRDYELRQINKKLSEEIGKINEQADAIRAKLNLPEKKKEEAEKTEEAEKKEKPKRELTQEEKDLHAKKQALFDKIGKFKEERNALYDKHSKDYELFNKQQDEIYRIKYMTKLMKGLKKEESQKKWEAEKDKRKEEELEKLRQTVAAKFNEDLEVCEYLAGAMQQLKIKEQMGGDLKTSNTNVEFKVNDKTLKAENLVFMKPKKDDDEGVKPGQKKLGKKSNKKKAEPEKEEEEKFNVDITTQQSLLKLGIQVPTSLDQVDKAITDCLEKKQELLKRRDEEVAKVVLKEEVIDETKEEKKEEKEEKKEEKRQEKDTKPKDIKFDEESFPSLA